MNIYGLSYKALTVGGSWVEGLVEMKAVDGNVVPMIQGKRIKENTVCQNVDRVDYRSRKIYTGDIMIYPHKDYGNIPAVVSWNDETLSFMLEMTYVSSLGQVRLLDQVSLADVPLWELEVIGNVHSTPDLAHWGDIKVS